MLIEVSVDLDKSLDFEESPQVSYVTSLAPHRFSYLNWGAKKKKGWLGYQKH